MDIVEQLRKCANTVYYQDGYTFRLGLQNEAADEIERLRDAVRWALPYVKNDERVKAIVRTALKEGE